MEQDDLTKVDEIIDKYGSDSESLIQILLDIQNEYRWLSKPILSRICDRLDITTTRIYHLATFYKHFSLLPQGRHSISVCLGTACHVRGATRLLDRVTEAIGVEPGQTTPDEKFTLNTVNCIGCCALGPVMVVDEDYVSNPKAKEIGEIVASRD
jgi:NADH-quinone oxidoreductase subunit E